MPEVVDLPHRSHQAEVTVLAFAAAAAALGWTSRRFRCCDGESAASLVDRIQGVSPALRELRPRLRFAVNQAFVDADAHLKDGDELALLPPLAGG
jgi:molybdopterin converting factor small subunit